MKTKEEILSILKQHENELRKRFHVVRIGIFGSYARNEQDSGSDLDLLVEFEDNTPNLYDLKSDLSDFLMQRLGLEVDICREKFIKPRIRQSILKEVVYAG